MSTQPGGSEDADNLGANTDQDGANAADRAENLGANTEEEGTVSDDHSDGSKLPGVG